MKRDKNERRRRHKRKHIELPNISVPDERKTRFSFEKIDFNHAVFSLDKCTQEFWVALVETLKQLESMDLAVFLESSFPDARHEIDFSKTIERDGFPGIDTEQQIPYQFPIRDKSTPWRAYGYVSYQIFYIVWLDTEHCFYNTKGKS